MVAWRSTFPCEYAFRTRCVAIIRHTGYAYSYGPQAFALLKSLFPLWVTLSDAVGPCAVCDTLAESSREDKRGLRKKAEEEKVDL
jgi:hypothetical protein